jgi:hypothetical protein
VGLEFVAVESIGEKQLPTEGAHRTFGDDELDVVTLRPVALGADR